MYMRTKSLKDNLFNNRFFKKIVKRKQLVNHIVIGFMLFTFLCIPTSDSYCFMQQLYCYRIYQNSRSLFKSHTHLTPDMIRSPVL